MYSPRDFGRGASARDPIRVQSAAVGCVALFSPKQEES